MAAPEGFWIIVGGYAFCMVLGIAGVAFMMRGFMGPWIKVKASRGKKVLVRVMSVTGDYYKPGTIDEATLRFKDRRKENRLIGKVKLEDTYDSMGVKCIDIDDEKNTTVDRKLMKMVNGFDSKHYDSLYERILLRPGQTNTILIAILILVIIALFAAIINGYIGFQTYKLVSQILAHLGNVTASTIPPGV